ncbi:MAG: cobyric acid synthase [Hyphomicrobiales bacterium]
MPARAIMIMGTGSDVGKSLISAGLCRLYANRGLRVTPFKPQNMSNNAAVTADGGEIGRAQALQARAARVETSVHMNPVLLKPESGTGAQVIVQGKRTGSVSAREFFECRHRYLPAILQSFHRLAAGSDLIIVEGAGSPAETNLRRGDLANMGFAEAADLPAILVGDIHRGGVIASIVGTFRVLSESDASRLKGFIINRFQGDPSLFREGVSDIEQATGTPCFGVVPHLASAARLPAEDSVALEGEKNVGGGSIKIAVMRLPRIANFDDFDPLKLEPGVQLTFVAPGEPVPADAKVVVIPGSKSTIADLSALRKDGWAIDIAAHARRGGAVLGLCGGYQMLGKAVHDPQGLEGSPGSAEGLGLLDVETTLLGDKTLTRVEGVHVATGAPISGYEMHLGETRGPDCARPFAAIGSRKDGAMSPTRRIMGTYLHGCFAADAFRSAFLEGIGASPGKIGFEATVEESLDELASDLGRHLDIDRILALAVPTKA